MIIIGLLSPNDDRYIHYSLIAYLCFLVIVPLGRGNGLAVESRPGKPEIRGSIPRSAAAGRRSSALSTLYYCVVLPRWCCESLASNYGLHVHCGLGQLISLPTSGDDK